MGSGIFTRKARKRIFHDKIQQSSINITRFTTVRGAIRVLIKSLLLVLAKSHNLVLSWAIVTSKQSNTRANKKQAKKRRTEKRANKTARVKWGEENERQMANNVMREIRVCDGYLVCSLLRRLPGNGARNPSCYLLSTCVGFPLKRKGWCSKVA